MTNLLPMVVVMALLLCVPLVLEPVLRHALWPQRLLAPYSWRARRRLAGHWELYAVPWDDDGRHWRQVETCHKALPCPFRHGGGCALLRCEDWSYRVGPDDNIVGAG